MTSYRIAALNGDGIGPEITQATLAVLKAALKNHPELQIEWLRLPMGFEAIESHGHPLPSFVLPELQNCHGWILGPHDCAAYPEEFQSELNPSGTIRKHFDLYANLRPARKIPGLPSVVEAIDLVIARENTEGFYADRNMHWGTGEFLPVPGVALAVGVFTEKAAERIAHTAFQLARSRCNHVSNVHKANVLRATTGLFLKTCRRVGEQYPQVRVEDYHIDAMAAHLVRRPAEFDVIVTTNMFGDILSDLTAELAGSLGTGGSVNAGGRHAMAQAIHGGAPDIAGKGVANPTGLLRSSVLLFQWLARQHDDPGLEALANTVDQALDTTLTSGVHTPDLGGTASTNEFAQAVIARL